MGGYRNGLVVVEGGRGVEEGGTGAGRGGEECWDWANRCK